MVWQETSSISSSEKNLQYDVARALGLIGVVAKTVELTGCGS
ncbi:hypothetical protein JCM19233_801 [Vibrio astriarenae]|nr:hypothetical protein JCM19233_801 [Vibrio sp. C7]